MGCGSTSTARGVWLGIAASLSSFTLRFSLFSLLYFSHSDSVSQIGFWFDLERDLSDSLKVSQCRVKHNLLWRIKEKDMVATVAEKRKT